MRNQGRILRLIVLIILNITVSAMVVAVFNFTYAQETRDLHQKTLYYLAEKQSSKQNAHITVGLTPTDILHGELTSTLVDNSLQIYVANSGYNTVSVIDVNSNTIIKNIPVGRNPTAIGVDPDTSRIYVANSDDNTISVIDILTNTNFTTITVGRNPTAIGVDPDTSRIYVANSGDNTVSVIDGNTNTKIAKVPVGRLPSAIGFNINRGLTQIYVANSGDNTVSVIDSTSNTNNKNIHVGAIPKALGGTLFGNKLYVANSGDNTVSVIDGTTDTKIKDIPVGRYPSAMGYYLDKIYVANRDSNTVSVIDENNNTNIGNIPVGVGPTALDANHSTNTIYVANSDENSVSVIDYQANKVVARVMFSIKPFNSGYIECDKLKAPLSQQFYVYSGSQCTAKPYQGFGFLSWEENLGHNSTQVVKVLPPLSPLDPFLDIFYPDKPEAKLNITKFGNFTANFRALPPPIPPEYIATLFGIVVTAFVSSWLTPAIIGWRKTKTQRKYFGDCISQIGKLDKNILEDKIIGTTQMES